MKRLFSIIGFLALCANAFGAAMNDYDSVWKCDGQKFNWYCDNDEDDKQTPSETKSNEPIRVELSDIKTAEQMRAELKRREDTAVMEPTPAHMRDYLEAWQFAQEKGAVFADSWRRVVWQNPDLDYSLKRPTNNVAIRTYDQRREQNEGDHLRALAKEHGLIFFFRSDCPYCHQMAPMLKMLSQRYGMEILPVSLDGGGLPDYPNPRVDQGQAAKLGVDKVPALFIGSKITGERAPIGFGAMSLSDIVSRIFVLTGTAPGQSF